MSLYNAVNHSHYTDAKELEIVTLENAVYMNMKNDQAFLLDMQLNLYEHQSTWNPNMPLRFLILCDERIPDAGPEPDACTRRRWWNCRPRTLLYSTMEKRSGKRKVLLKLSHSFMPEGR